jgi:tyrocidine synthetase III
MNNVIKLILKLAAMDVRIYLEQGILKIDAPEGFELDTVLPEIRLHKEDIVRYLSQKQDVVAVAIPQAEQQLHYALSSSQRRLWILSQFEESSLAYNMPALYVIEGELNMQAMQRAFNALITRHEILRTIFEQNADGDPGQRILSADAVEFNIEYTDLRHALQQDEELKKLVNDAFSHVFDLTKGPLLRATVYQLSASKWIFGFVMHHIISDGWSVAILMKELMLLYNEFITGTPAGLQPLRIQYKDYAVWQQQQLDEPALQLHKTYWMEQFAGPLPVLEMPADKLRPAVKTFNGDIVETFINATVTRRLHTLCNEHGCSLFMGLLAAVNAMLYRYTGQEDIVVGSPIAGRPHHDLREQIGFYVNTLALRARFDGDKSFAELLQNIKHVTLGAYEHQLYPFDVLIEDLGVERNRGRNPLFDVMVQMQNEEIASQEIGGLKLTTYEGKTTGTSKFDLLFDFVERGDDIQVRIEFNTDIYERASMERAADHFVQLLAVAMANPATAISELNYLSEKEIQQVLIGFNDTAAPYPAQETLVSLFEAQVAKRADAVALVFAGKKFTYCELNAKANRLARWIKANYKVLPDDIVAIKLKKSEWMIVSILAVLKSGAAYLPIDPTYPQDRIDYMLADSACKLLIDKETIRRFKKVEDEYQSANPLRKNTSADLAYVIYTSGSTGKPKGCMLEHRGVVNRIEWMWAHYGFTANDVILQKTNFTFDVSVWEIFMPLCWGAKMVLCEADDVAAPDRIALLIETQQVTCLHFVPGMLNAFIASLFESNDIDQRMNSLRLVITSGEALSPETVRSWHQKMQAPIHNLYGPTEASVDVTYFETSAENKIIPIGRPIWNTQLYITGKKGELLPIGVFGDINIAGDGLARGYLNKPALTAEKFVANPFFSGRRMYKTGDIGRWLPDGNIEFAGRKDDQVKVRGYRIELGEIENALLLHDEITAAVVVARANKAGEKELVAYVSGRGSVSDKATARFERPDRLREFLGKLLPSYMVPSYFVRVEAMPLNASGKIDRKQLPAVEEMDLQAGVEFIAPRNATEEKLVSLWQDILGREKISVKADFFDVGGHSLAATRLASRIYKTFEAKIALKDLFAFSILEHQAKFIGDAQRISFEKISAVAVQESYELSSSQRRLWVLSQFEEANAAYNIPAVYELQGALDVKALQDAFTALMERHEILRTSFSSVQEGEVRQVVHSISDVAFKVEYIDVRESNMDEANLNATIQQEFVRPFDLAEVPLLRAVIYQVDDDKWLLTYVMHHIISDGWSMGILIQELLVLYRTFAGGGSNPFAPLTIQYKDYAAWQQRQMNAAALTEHKNYWLQQFAGELPVLELPLDKKRAANKTYNGAVVSGVINKELTRGIKALSQQQGGTLFMALAACVNTLLYKYTGQSDVILGSQIAGRDHADLDGQIGFYLNTLALRTKFSATDSYNDLLAKVKQITLDAYEHSVYPFDELIDALQLQHDVSRNALFDVTVVLHNTQHARVEGDSNLQVKEYAAGKLQTSRFELSFDFEERNDEIQTKLVYNRDIFNAGTIERLYLHLQQLISAIINQPSIALNKLDYFTADEKQQLLVAFNDTQVEYPADRSIVDLFEQQVQQTPGKIALVFGEKQLTYKELDEQSNRLAHHLKATLAIQPDDKIGIMLDRSDKLLIAILGVLKSGAAYVPVDADYPKARKAFILQDTAVKSLITQTDYIFDLDYYSGDVFAIDVQLDGLATSVEAPALVNQPTDLAYVMYTSGSMGKPKGVMVEHRGVVRLVKSSNYVAFTGDETILSTGAVSFDATTFEYWGALLNGGKLVLCSKETLLDEQRLAEEIRDKEADTMWFTAGWLNQLVEKDITVFDGLKTIVAGGDKLSPHHINALRTAYPGVKIINGYGPTENTTFSLTYEITGVVETIPVGKPISNSSAYIVDANNQLCAVGVVGEICVGGDGLARGYLNNPELTAEKFVANFGQRLYKTGDLGRWMPDGNIEFLGRKDEQVKIRGFRIEPGEIENALLTHPAVDAAVVIVKTTGEEKEIIAYVTGAANDLREYLGKSLPAYMIPSYFVKLDELPLTSNGKVDRKNLPAPEELGLESATTYIAPRNKTEEKLVAIWQDILGKQNISVTANFFEVGGHSLKATRLASQIHKEFEVKIELKELFANLVLEQQAQLIEQAQKTAFVAIKPLPVQPDYILSSSQRRLWIVSQFAEGNVAYNMPGAYSFEGVLDRDALAAAFNTLIERHENLRTVFKEDEQGQIKQFIKSPGEGGFSISFHDLRSEEDQQETIQQLLQAAFSAPFDLVNGPLLRAGLYQVGENKWVFSYVMHHIISDGWSMEILLREMLVFYHAYVNGKSNPLAPLRIQYKDYAAWQQQQLSGESLAAHKNYWLQQFEGELPVLEMPVDKKRPAAKTYNGASVSGIIDAAVINKLRTVSQQQNATMFMAMLAAINTLLYRYTGQEDIITGTQIAGRDHADLEDQIGMYLNTLALRTRFKGSQSFTELLSLVKQVTLEAYQHQVYPFDELVDELNLQRDTSRHPLFDVSVVLHNTDGMQHNHAQTGLKVSAYEAGDNLTSKFDLAFDLTETGDSLQVIIVYNTDLFTAETAQRLSKHLNQVLIAVSNNAHVSLNKLDYFTADEKQQLLVAFNDTQVEYPADRSIVDLFEQQVQQTPGKIALVFGEKQLTYKELDEQSNRLAHHLKATLAIQPDDKIGIMLDRSDKLLIAILGVLKSGAAYVPVDADYPKARKAFILQDTAVKSLITQTDYIFDLDYYSGDVFAIDVQLDGLATSVEAPALVNQPTDLAYVMYTSGSMGKPKGVMVEHRGVVRLVKSSNYVAFTGDETILSTGAVSFDATTFEYWGALLNGGKLVLCSKETLLDEQRLAEEIRDKEADTMWFTAGWLNQLVEKDITVFDGLKTIVAGGDKLSPHHINALRTAYPGVKMVNGYGPTENTTFSLTYEITGVVETIPVGKPISNSSAYIIDSSGQLCAVGVVGEICVGGDGLARGYLNNPELTAEKFVANSGQRLYKTGDLGRWMADGNIEFIGRKDEQVKIRGFRIELGEIENALLTHPAVDAAVVIVKTTGQEKEIIAYVTGAANDLREYLGKSLPAYMIPSYFVKLDELPLTSNGKVDRKNLPAPEELGLESATTHIAPRNKTEEKLIAIWQEILGKQNISVTANFFEIGGHSLKATRLASQIHKEFEVKIELKELFAITILEQQAQLIEKAQKTLFMAIRPLQEQPHYAVSSSQRRLWVLSRFAEANTAYNVPRVYVFKGDLQIDALQYAFDNLVARHEILRTVFKEDEEGDIRQFIQKEITFSIAQFDLRNEKDAQGKIKTLVQQECNKPFSLSDGPLLRATTYRAANDEWIFCYVIHHIISDGWSMDVIIKELLQFYNAYVHGQPDALQPLPIQYKDYAAWQQDQLSGVSLGNHKNYWLQQFAGELPVLEFPADKPRPAVKTYHGGAVTRTLPADLANQLNAFAQEQGATLFMSLLAAVNVLLHRYTGQGDIIIGSPIANRQHADLEEQIGYYLNTLALRSRFTGNETFRELLVKVKQVTLDAYEHQVYPFDELVDELKLHRDTSRHPLFDVMVVLQNAGADNVAAYPKPEGLEITGYNQEEQVLSKFDWLFGFASNEDSIQLSLEYNNDIYHQTTAEQLCNHLEQLLKAMLEQPGVAVGEINYLREEERHTLITTFNKTGIDYISNKTLSQLFEEQAAKTPDNVALVFRDKKLTYRELNEEVNQLAAYLKTNYNIQPDDLVAVKMEKNEWMIVSILAVHKSGGAYVPIDPEYPQDRIDYMLEDSKCKLLIDDVELDLFRSEQDNYSSENVECINKSTDLAYVIYTSGSTGRPKGCMVEHRGVVNRLEWLWKQYRFTDKDVMLQKTAFTFDVSVGEIFMPLCFGARVVLCPSDDARWPQRITNLVYDQQVTCLHFVPGMMNAFIAFLFETENVAEQLKSVRLVLASGEALSPETVNNWYKRMRVPILNMYGPTEASIEVATYEAGVNDSIIPIGRPISNTQLYITGSRNELVPVGVIGEINIAGVGLARGYINKPELTEQKFVANPFEPGQRMYRTGDQGRWLPDGNIEFIGRKDDQVKIRGYRIETGEIENALLAHQEIAAAAVVAKANAQAEKELVAYVVADADISPALLRAHLSKTLPSYMVPSQFVQLPSMPLTASGKTDRKQLLSLQANGMQTGVGYVAPRNTTEEKLVQLWREILGRENIGVKDNFFDLGGHSLKATRLIARIKKEFNTEIDLKNIFHEPTIEVLSDTIINNSWFNASVEEEEAYEEVRI